mgnify:CR=1 FL=1
MIVSFISLGCDKNRVNTEQMMALCLQSGMTVQEDCAGSDVVVVNTCGFIDSAKLEAIETILSVAELKAAGRVGKILVTGCLSQRYQAELLEELPEVDGIMGTGSYGDIVSAVEQVAAGQRAEAGYLEQIAQLESRNKQLQGQINDVTQRWIDEKGKSHPIECVFTRGFVRQYNAALGYDNASVDTGHSDSVAATGTRSGTATGQPETTDTRLRDSGVSQRDVLANIIDNAGQCRRWRNQINALLDEREGLQK